MAGNSRRTELQVLIQALTAVQYEIRSLVLVVNATEEVMEEARQLHIDAKHLMQSAEADANALAFMGQKGPPSLEGEDEHRECC